MHPLASFCKLIFLNLVQSMSVKAVESCAYLKDKKQSLGEAKRQNGVWERHCTF
jgi:hypothetical protein